MAGKLRRNYSLDEDIVERLESQVPHGDRSQAVEDALDDYLDDK